MPEFLDFLKGSQSNHEMKERLSNKEPAFIAELFDELDKTAMIRVFRLLSKDKAAEVFSYLDSDLQRYLLEILTDKEIGAVVNEMFADDAVDMLQELPANLVRKILENTDETTRTDINFLLQYPDHSAGSIMTTEYVSLPANITVAGAFERIRLTGPDKETIYTCYVTDFDKRLVGVISVREMIMAEPGETVSELMEDNNVFVYTTDDREAVAKVFHKYGFSAVPVVDSERRLVGIVTADDIIDVIRAEDTEDIEKMHALRPSEKPYMEDGVIGHWKRRVGWLIFLAVSGVFSSIILNGFEEVLSAVIVLSYSIPFLMGTGGNAGSQSSTLIIRGMALGEIHAKDIFKVMLKEICVALLCALLLAPVVFLKVRFLDLHGYGYPPHVAVRIAFTVSLTLICTLLISKLIGGLLPIVAKMCRLDPAVMAAPLITTIVDAATLLIYFGLAMTLVMPNVGGIR